MSELIQKYNELEAMIKAKRAEIEGLENAQGELREAMPTLWYARGFGNHGFVESIGLVAHTETETIAKLKAKYPQFEVFSSGQFAPIGNMLGDKVAGMIESVTPVDKHWDEISKLLKD